MTIIQRPTTIVIPITGANGNFTTSRPAHTFHPTTGEILNPTLFHLPVAGIIRNVKARLVNGGGWTFTTIQVKVGRPIFNGIGIPPVKSLWSALGDEHLMYDSGATAPGVGSATACFVEAAFDDKKQGWFREWMAGIEWVTSAGAGSSSVILTLDVEEHVS